MTRRVLIVEDEVILVMFATMALEDAGFDVLSATDGRQGLEIARANTIDVVVTDYMMPGLDGLAMLRALRADGVAVPAIMVTAIPADHLDLDGDPPFERHILKPCSETELVEAVASLLDAPPGPD